MRTKWLVRGTEKYLQEKKKGGYQRREKAQTLADQRSAQLTGKVTGNVGGDGHGDWDGPKERKRNVRLKEGKGMKNQYTGGTVTSGSQRKMGEKKHLAVVGETGQGACPRVPRNLSKKGIVTDRGEGNRNTASH